MARHGFGDAVGAALAESHLHRDITVGFLGLDLRDAIADNAPGDVVTLLVYFAVVKAYGL